VWGKGGGERLSHAMEGEQREGRGG
jgi:hypothetical protein